MATHPVPIIRQSGFRLSILDQSPIPEGLTVGDALHNSLDLATLADGLGFHRYWLAEHHGTPALACNSPEVLMGPVAAITKNLRIGSGGIMLPHYSPLKVAESFQMLDGMFPGRIDLGIGRAAGTSPKVAIALQRDRRQRPPDDFRDQLTELLGYFGEGGPKPWLLGSSLQSAIWAAELGLPYVFADFINPEGAAVAAYYRRYFQPSARLLAPKLAVAGWALCADTSEKANDLALSVRMMLTLMFRGRLIPVPTVERAREFIEQEGLAPELLPTGRRFITGDRAAVRTGIESLAAEYQAEEVLVVNILHSHEARRRSYQLLAEEFELNQMPVSTF